ncbi:MAG TPA: diguanylate cyclase, partial [Myxococcota bacterium]|nr:diguanylate cyclase [Myxococcota bacterium]
PDEESLMLLVNRLRELMPPHALLARQSGGGFLVALPQAVLESEVQACCERLQVDVHQSLALLGAGRESPPTLSIGHATVRQDLADAISRRDAAVAILRASERQNQASVEALRLVEARYTAGAALYSELAAARLARVGAQRAVVGAQSEVYRAELRLRWAVGEDL